MPHHLIDLVDPDEDFTVAQFQHAADEALRTIASRGRHALLVGGTGLYLRAVVDDLAIPGRYPEVAAALESELEEGRCEVADLHAAPAHARPGRGRPDGADQPPARGACARGDGRLGAALLRFGPGLEAYPASVVGQIGLARPPDEIDRRIAARMAAMVDAGLVEEVAALAARPCGISRTARQALGYREILGHVEHGVPLADCVEEAVRRTRQFARRQASWFRRDPRISWAQSTSDAQELLERALSVHG